MHLLVVEQSRCLVHSRWNISLHEALICEHLECSHILRVRCNTRLMVHQNYLLLVRMFVLSATHIALPIPKHSRIVLVDNCHAILDCSCRTSYQRWLFLILMMMETE